MTVFSSIIIFGTTLGCSVLAFIMGHILGEDKEWTRNHKNQMNKMKEYIDKH
jgi:hypothetical protein